MNLKELFAKHKMNVTGVIQIGACNGEELDNFSEADVPALVLIDANPLTMPELRRKIENRPYTSVHHALIWDKDSEIVKFRIMDFLACSTAIPDSFPELSEIRVIDLESQTLKTFLEKAEVPAADYNMLFIDVEGSELKVLAGADLSKIEYIYVEFQSSLANTPEALAAALPDFEEVDRVTQPSASAASGTWGDILFVRKPQGAETAKVEKKRGKKN